jgi:hypothetical protein
VTTRPQLKQLGLFLGRLIGADFNTTADQAIPIGAGLYVPRRIIVTNPSTSLTLAAGGIYTGAGKTGTIVVPAAQVYSALTGATKFLDLTLNSLTDVLSASQLLLSLTVAQGAAATGDVYLFGDVLQ